VGQWPEVKTPILAMNGTLDPQTPIGKANAAQENLRGPHQHFVTMPWSPHGVAFASPVATAGAPPCGMQLVRGFLADPHAEPDTACINDLLPPFALNPNVTARFFGSLDMWENTERASAVATTTTASTHASVAIDPRAFQVRPLALGPVVTP
jgi:hypothetical protein